MSHPYILAVGGGALVGISASILMLFNGQILGVSGIISQTLKRPKGATAWRAAFIVGMLLMGALVSFASPALISSPTRVSPIAIGLAGLMVGFGSRLGNGCTSGHGVCGLSRFSIRSLVATLTFVGTGIVAATLMQGSL